ncbi:uncharacterized protein LOC114265774 [Camellia sinensis]|uniref:uncharacterized protein LOC114265774 n=1 Tax=Camellia sinensis TaxID=4442 RepID=UPI0010361E51|nr:uncharacterized protein LOC114265774 [Camellia sinensis]
MKTVSGKVISTKTISLSKSAKVLSNFVSAETGGSQAVSSYLTRASASFNALVQFHKELKNSKFDHIESPNNENPVKYEHKSEENEVGLTVEDSVGSHSARKTHKQSRKKNDSFVIEEVGEGFVLESRQWLRACLGMVVMIDINANCLVDFEWQSLDKLQFCNG